MSAPHNKSNLHTSVSLMRRLIAGAILANVFVYLVGGLSLYKSRTDLEKRNEITTQNLAKVFEDNINGTINKIDLTLLTVKDTTEEQLASGKINGKAINSAISRAFSRMPELESLRVANQHGVVAYGIGVVKQVNITDRDYFIRLRDNPRNELVFAKPVKSRMTGKRVLNIARRLNYPNGTFAGVVFAQLTEKYFLDSFALVNVGNYGSIALRKADFDIIARYSAGQSPIPESDRQKVSPQFKELVRSGSKQATFKARFPLDNIERLNTTHRIGEYPLYITVGRGTSEYLINWRIEAAAVLTLLLLFSLGTVIFCRALIQRWNSEKQIAEELRQTNEELVILNRELQSFCYSISHEFRAPIARLIGFSRMIGEYLDLGQQQNAVHVAQRISVASERLRSVVDSLLMMSRLSRAELKMEQVNLSAIAQDIVHRLMEEDHDRAVIIRIEPGIMVTGDVGMLSHCMENLLQNAFKYTCNKAEAEIEVGRISTSGERAVFVRDNGAGFDIAFANKLFEPFCRLHSEDEFTGNGIGLAVVQRIIEKHGGKIWATSTPDHGATFYFTIAS